MPNVIEYWSNSHSGNKQELSFSAFRVSLTMILLWCYAGNFSSAGGVLRSDMTALGGGSGTEVGAGTEGESLPSAVTPLIAPS